MTTTAALQHADTFGSPCDFIHGKEYVHPNGEVVKFTDNSWGIRLTPGKQTSVTFRGLPEWLVRPAKLTLAHGWLTLGRSPLALQVSG
jgi:hypothetical protein